MVLVSHLTKRYGGHTAVDLKGRSGKPAHVSVALGIDVPRFRRWLVDAVKNSAKLGDK